MAWKARFSCRVKLKDGTTTSLNSGDVFPSNAEKDLLFGYKFYWSEKDDVVEIEDKKESNPIEMRTNKVKGTKKATPIFE